MTWPEQAPTPAKALSASFSHAGHQNDRELGLEPIKHTARRLKAFWSTQGRWPRRKIARLAVAGAKSPRTGGRSPQTGAKTPERRKRPIFAPWPPKRGNTRPRDTQTRSEADKRLPRHPARLVAPQNRGDERAGVAGVDERGRRCAGMPHRRRHKKTPPEGIRTASFTSSNCPRGKTVFLTKRCGV